MMLLRTCGLTSLHAFPLFISTMARSPRFLLVALLTAAVPASAQITITHADYEAALLIEGTNTLYATESSAALTALAAQTGANQTWNFTGLTYDPAYVTTVTRVERPVPGSGDPHFARASHIFRIESPDSTAYTFQTLSASAATFLGLTGSGVLVRFVPEKISAVLPFTFGTTWTSNYETQLEPSLLPGITLTTQDSIEVVGWGTLVTPAGSTEALMIRTKTTSTVSFPPLPPTVTTSAQVLFTAYGLLNAEVFLSPTGPASGNYNVYNSGGTAGEPAAGPFDAAQLDAVAPNPLRSGDAAQIAFSLPTAAAVRLDVLDALGRRVATILDGAQAAGRHQATWGPGDLASGVYLVRLTAGEKTAFRRLTLTR